MKTENENVNKNKVINRLSRLEGQIRGVRKMIEEEKECEAIVTQLSAVHSALEGATKMIIVGYFEECLQEAENNGAERKEALDRLAALLLNTRL
jgi:DNA-binding FrmR family transcriptional regulator